MPDAVRRAFASMFPPNRSEIQNPARRRVAGLYDTARNVVEGLPGDARRAAENWRVEGTDLVRRPPRVEEYGQIRGMSPRESLGMEMAKATAPGASAIDRLALADMVLPGMTRAKAGIRAFAAAPYETALDVVDDVGIPGSRAPAPLPRTPFRHHDRMQSGMGAGGDFKGRGIYLAEDKRIAEGYLRMLGGPEQGHVRTHNIPPQAKLFDATTEGVTDKTWQELRGAFEKKMMPEGSYGDRVRDEVAGQLDTIEELLMWRNANAGKTGMGRVELDEVMSDLGQVYEDIWGPSSFYANEKQGVWNLLEDLGYDGLKYNAGTQFGVPAGTKRPVNYVLYNYDVINNPNKAVPKAAPAPEKALRQFPSRRDKYMIEKRQREQAAPKYPSRDEINMMMQDRGYTDF